MSCRPIATGKPAQLIVNQWSQCFERLGVTLKQIIRRILVDHARGHKAEKRGTDAVKLSLDEAMAVPEERQVDLVALDDSLNSLASFDVQQGRIVELRFFGGLSIEETAEVLGVSPATVKRDWAMAKAWLYRDMTSGPGQASLQ